MDLSGDEGREGVPVIQRILCFLFDHSWSSVSPTCWKCGALHPDAKGRR